jgi:hypothetical protein
VADVHPSEIRIGDTERESALTALGDHMSAGRLDINEYGDRTARVAAAKTRGELLEVFGDLPQPHPKFGVASPASGPAATGTAMSAPTSNGILLSRRLMTAAVPLACIAAVVLAFTVNEWLFVLIPVVLVLRGAFYGDDWKHQRRMTRERYRQERRDFRRRGRGW